jgi:RNA polymerase sigma-70 factor (ECF subfamily)
MDGFPFTSNPRLHHEQKRRKCFRPERSTGAASNEMANEGESNTSASLLLRIRDPRDGSAWVSFVAVYAPLVTGHCRRKGLQDADAADVAQNVMTRVSNAIRTFEYEPQRGRFRSWLGTITANEIATQRMKSGRQPGTGNEAVNVEAADPEWNRDFTEHVLAVAMDRIRGEFEPATWQSFEASWIRREPPVEIATRLGTAIHAVYVNKSRVLKRLETEVIRLAEDLPLNSD